MTSNESAQGPKWFRVKGNHYEKRDISLKAMKTDHRNLNNHPERILINISSAAWVSKSRIRNHKRYEECGGKSGDIDVCSRCNDLFNCDSASMLSAVLQTNQVSYVRYGSVN